MHWRRRIDEYSFCNVYTYKERIFKGPNTRDEFCKWLFLEEKEETRIFCHNFRGYDSYPIVSYMYENAILPEVIDRNILLYRILKTMFRENYAVVSSKFCLQSSYYSVIVFIFELFFFKLKSNGLIYLYFHLQFETNNNNYCSWKTSVRLSCRWPKTRILVLRLRAFLGCFFFFARQSWNASMIPTCIARCK